MGAFDGPQDFDAMSFFDASGGLVFASPANPLENPPTLPDDNYSLSYRLFRHYRARPVGRNVYILSDDTVTERDPDGYSILWRESDRTSDATPGCPHVTHVFWGGHDADEITDEEAVLLEDAGYDV